MAGERQVSVIETQSVTSGFVESAQQAKALDAAFDGVTESSKALTQAEISLESSVNRLDSRFNESVRTANDVAKAQDTIARARKQGVGTEEQYARILTGVTERHEAALARQAAGLRQTGAAANDNAKTFGLAGHQVQNLTFQLNDLATQIASGGGIFRPLIQQGGQVFQVLQMSEGGVGGVLKNIGTSLARIGPLALTAFGAAGVAGAVALAANALSNFQENLKRSEASVRSLTDSSAQANQVLAGAAEAAKGTRLLAEDLQQTRLQAETLANTSGRIEQLANGLTRLAPSLNAQAFTQGVANIVSGMGASREEMQKMIGAVNDLGGKLTLTAGEAQKLAQRFPELAGMLAQAFGTTPQGLLQIPKQLEISTVRLEEFITAAGKSENANSSVLNLTDSIIRLVSSIDNLFGLSKGWDFFWGNVAKGANIAANAIDKFLSKAEDAAKAPAVRTQAPPPTTARDPAADRNYSSRNIVGGQDIGASRETASNTGKTLREIHEGNVARQAAEERAASDAASAQRTADYNAQQERAAEAATLRAQDRTAKAVEDQKFSQRAGFNWAQQGALDAFGKALDPARNSLDGMTAAVQRVTKSIIPLENTMQSLIDKTPGGGQFQGGYYGGAAAQLGSDKATADRMLTDMLRERIAGENPQLSSQEIDLMAQQEFNDSMGHSAVEAKRIAEEFAALTGTTSDLGASMQTAADKLGDIGSLGSPIKSKIDQLMQLQQAALSRVYKPDPYAEKNPEYFYNGEKIMKEGQDRIFDGLQTQIEKLQSLQASLGQLVVQGQQLPMTLVNALIAAGFGDIAQKIIAAFATAPAPSATPNPTAVLMQPSTTTRGDELQAALAARAANSGSWSVR